MRKKIYSIIITIAMTVTLSLNKPLEVKALPVFPGRFDTGILTYGVIGNSNSTFASKAVNQWNNITSNVKITKYTGSDPKNAKLRLNFNSVVSPTDGLLGMTFLYKGTKVTDLVDASAPTWTNALCVQYKSYLYSNDNQRLKTCVHEIGHSLSLAHPSGGFKGSVMVQGLSDNYKVTLSDKLDLVYKFGGGFK